MNYGSYQRGVYAKLFRGYADLFLIGLQVQGSGVPVYFGCWVAGVTVKANNVEGCVGWLAAAVSNNAMFVCVAIYGFATRGSSRSEERRVGKECRSGWVRCGCVG